LYLIMSTKSVYEKNEIQIMSEHESEREFFL